MLFLKQFLHSFLWLKRHLFGQLKVDEIKVIKKYLKADDTFLDIGVHAGSWAIPISKICFKGHIYGFEALPYYAGVLEMMLKFMNNKNITIINNAVLDKNCQIKMINKDSNGNELTGLTHIKGDDEENDGGIFVKGITIDSFIESKSVDQVGFIKCDVEGAELLVFRGAIQTIKKWRPIIFCEINDDYCTRYRYTSTDIFKFFSNLNYNSFTISTSNEISSINVETYQGNGDVLFLPVEIN